MMRRRPLLRAAAIGGGAYMAGKRSQSMAAPAAAEAVAAPPEPAPAPAAEAPDMIGQLSQLAKLHEQGVLTAEEFAQQKARILAA
jgi:hypothetical protein